MRLLNTNTLNFAEFFDADVPPYAILSHRWQDGEVSFREMKAKHRSMIRTLRGFQKIQAFCRRAREDNIDWAWIDTCCIDKRSSAELSEAINSMYAWYRRGTRCYAYLSDLPGDVGTGQDRSLYFRRSAYWTRGWTVQEFLAPDDVELLDADWASFGLRSDLADVISAITNIRPVFLARSHARADLSTASIAERMSWASNRKTSRIEDIAYSLLGIFDINMPLLYGEGHKAFTRLQREIMAQNEDESILTWLQPPQPDGHAVTEMSLAEHPRTFLTAAGICTADSLHEGLSRQTYGQWFEARPPSTITSRGLRLESPLIPWRPVELGLGAQSWLLPLKCSVPALIGACLAIEISRTPGSSKQYARNEGAAMYFVRPIVVGNGTVHGCEIWAWSDHERISSWLNEASSFSEADGRDYGRCLEGVSTGCPKVQVHRVAWTPDTSEEIYLKLS